MAEGGWLTVAQDRRPPAGSIGAPAGTVATVAEEGWYIDPYGAHEQRWFSAGAPTALVRDRGVDGQDPPPAGPIPGPLVRIEPEEGPSPGYFLRADDAERTAPNPAIRRADDAERVRPVDKEDVVEGFVESAGTD